MFSFNDLSGVEIKTWKKDGNWNNNSNHTIDQHKWSFLFLLVIVAAMIKPRW